MKSGSVQDHPVMEAIRRRSAGYLDPSCKLGLVVEGGGMRGVYSGSALVALERLGFTSVFDEVYAESAGAINACYFLAGQAGAGIGIYLEDLQTPRFINPFRPAAVLDIDYVIDVVVKHRKPLDESAVLSSRSELFVAVTDAVDGSPRLVDVQREKLPLLSVLKASAAIVPLYNRPVLLNGKPYVDGGISNPIPIQSALDGGCTHILVLLTRPPEYEMRPFSGWQKKGVSCMLRGWPNEFVTTFFEERTRRYRTARELAFGNTRSTAAIAVIGPGPDSPVISRTTLTPGKLRRAMQDAINRTFHLFDRARIT